MDKKKLRIWTLFTPDVPKICSAHWNNKRNLPIPILFSITSVITLTKSPHSCGVVSLNNNLSEKNETIAFISMLNLNVIRRAIIVIYFLSGN